MALEDYRRKRSFTRTPEPSADPPPNHQSQWRFVVQKHHTRRLHYDLRLELDGVLKSWAIPKGPSLDPQQKRFAVHVEDHPLEYIEFEGVIPKGEYGGGTVMVWDLGHWQPLDDAQRDYREGKLKFRLDGHKLQGGWMLVRMTNQPDGENKNWLLFKERDDAARESTELDVLQEYPDSVLSQRSLSQIAADRDAVWTGPKSGDDDASQSKAVQPVSQPAFDLSTETKARPAEMPERIRPSLPTATRHAPSGDQWVHEIKFDGYRMLCHVAEGTAKFFSRNGLDWTDKLKSLSTTVAKLPAETAIIDGEVVMMAADGTTSFQALQNRIGAGQDTALRYYVFDLLYLNGYDLRRLRLDQRKQLLAGLLTDFSGSDRVLLSEHIAGDGPVVFQQACKLGAEGIVSKRIDRRYSEGRNENWLKTKCLLSQEFIVGGYTDPTATRKGFGAILLGYLDEEDQLQFAGKVGTGFTDQTLLDLRTRFDQLKTDRSPFHNLARRDVGRDVHWIRPQLVVEVEFGGWTDDRVIRFGSYRGLRDDVALADVGAPPLDVTNHDVGGDDRERAIRPTLDLPPELSQIRLTHPDRIVYPEQGITKLGVATYYAQVAAWMLPHIVGRPLSLLRCPQGCHEPCFFQKRAPRGLHESVERVTLPSREGDKIYLMVHDIVGLLSLVQFSVLEFHVWGARGDRPLKPDRMVFDLDPDESLPWNRVVTAAFEVRDLLESLGLKSFVKTTGGKGLHVVAPIQRRHQWDEIKRFSRQMASRLAGNSPGRFTMNSSKSARRGKIYLDFLRNTRGATAIAPYSTRARQGATVSVPVAWEELEILQSGEAYHVRNLARRMANLAADPWSQLPKIRQSITKAVLKKLGV